MPSSHSGLTNLNKLSAEANKPDDAPTNASKKSPEEGGKAAREPWPLGRFVKQALFFQRPSLRKTLKRVLPAGKKYSPSAAVTEKERVLFTSAAGGKSEWVRQWGALDDVVMGGVSESSLQLVPGAAEEPTGARLAAVFSGVVKTANNGGFASVRTRNFTPRLNLSGAQGLRLRVKGDGNRYKFILRDDPGWDSANFGFSFDTVAGEWITVDAPADQFVANFRSEKMRTDAPIQLDRIVSMQLMLSKFEYGGELNPNFTPGAFSLVIDKISVLPR